MAVNLRTCCEVGTQDDPLRVFNVSVVTAALWHQVDLPDVPPIYIGIRRFLLPLGRLDCPTQYRQMPLQHR